MKILKYSKLYVKCVYSDGVADGERKKKSKHSPVNEYFSLRFEALCLWLKIIMKDCNAPVGFYV